MTAPDTPSDLAARLTYYKERGQREIAAARDVVTRHSGENIVTLVAALEAVLAQADHFASEADRFGKLSETADEDSGAALAALAAWQAYDRCAKTFREAITSALTGTPQLSEDEGHG